MPSGKQNDKKTIIKPNLVIGEGDDEKFLLEALLEHLELKSVQAMGIGGKNNLKENLKMLNDSPKFESVSSIAILRDADSNPKGAFQSVQSALRGADLPVPDRPLEWAGTKPRVKVMIIPEAERAGMLEDICLESVSANPAMECVERYFECLKARQIEIESSKISKAKAHAFLASKEDPDKRLGEAAKAGYWPFDDQAFEQLKNFLRSIVE